MSEKPVGPLRRRMIEHMSTRRFGEKTQHDYIRHIETFAKFLGRSPDTATAEDRSGPGAGSSLPSARSRGRTRCSLISRATPIGWQSRTAV
jgi:hypothetical protein